MSLFVIFFFFALLSVTARDRTAQKTQMMANYQELHFIYLFFFYVNIFVNFHFCLKPFSYVR